MFYWSINNFQQLLVHLNFEQSIIQSGVCSYSSPKFCTKQAIFQTSDKIYFIHDLRGRGKFHGVMLEFFCRFFLYIVLFYLMIKSRSVDFYDFYFLTIIIPLFPPSFHFMYWVKCCATKPSEHSPTLYHISR